MHRPHPPGWAERRAPLRPPGLHERRGALRGAAGGGAGRPQLDLAPQHRPHDPGRVPGRRAGGVPDRAGGADLRVRYWPLHQPGWASRGSRQRAGRRRDHRRLRRRRPAGYRRVLLGTWPPASLLSQHQRRRKALLQGRHRGGGADGTQRRAAHQPGRLRQRRPPRPAHAARRLARLPWEPAQLPGPQPRQRDVRGRDPRRRSDGRTTDPDRGLDRHRPRRLARPRHRQRSRGRRGPLAGRLDEQRRRHLS